MNFPKIGKNQIAVVMAEGSTGIILNQNKVYYNKDIDNDMFSIFDSLDQAMIFIKNTAITNSTIEFIVYNYKQEMIKFIQ